ncbi:hypothetical protein ACTHAM_002386 [Cellulomonas soli]|uniref:hypothetical protein n=1 Tax=Cellulomonas soli TaxID=931535 RepID=UPI003F851269
MIAVADFDTAVALDDVAAFAASAAGRRHPVHVLADVVARAADIADEGRYELAAFAAWAGHGLARAALLEREALQDSRKSARDDIAAGTLNPVGATSAAALPAPVVPTASLVGDDAPPSSSPAQVFRAAFADFADVIDSVSSAIPYSAIADDGFLADAWDDYYAQPDLHVVLRGPRARLEAFFAALEASSTGLWITFESEATDDAERRTDRVEEIWAETTVGVKVARAVLWTIAFAIFVVLGIALTAPDARGATPEPAPSTVTEVLDVAPVPGPQLAETGAADIAVAIVVVVALAGVGAALKLTSRPLRDREPRR